MKNIIYITILLSCSALASETVWIKHQGANLKFTHNKGKEILLDLNQSFEGKLKIDNTSLTKKVCSEYRNEARFFLGDRDPEQISIQEYAQNRELYLFTELDGQRGMFPKPIVYLPYGVDLEDDKLLEKLADAVNIKDLDSLKGRVNADYIFKDISINVLSARDSILSYHSKLVQDKLIELLEQAIAITPNRSEKMRRGAITINSRSFEPICDLLYFGSKIKIKISAQENEKLVEEYSVPKKQVLSLFNQMKKEFKSNDSRDPFIAGLLTRAAIDKMKFKYPLILKHKLGADAEVKFLKSFFSNKYDWSLGEMSPSKESQILRNAYYARYEDGESFEQVIKLNVEEIR